MSAMFVFASGRGDNHDLSMLLAVSAFLVHLRGMRLAKSGWFLLSGILLGLAAGVRLTMLPMAGAMTLAILFPLSEQAWKTKLRSTGFFLAGLGCAMLPAIILVGLNYQRALFYIFFFNAEYNGAYWLEQGRSSTMGIFGKLAYLALEVTWSPAHYPLLRNLGGSWWGLVLMPFAQNGGLFLGLAMILFNRRLFKADSYSPWPELRRLALWSLPFILMAALSPTPAFYQYFYPLLPICMILISYSWAVYWRAFPAGSQAHQLFRRTLTVLSLSLFLLGGIGMLVMVNHWQSRTDGTPGQVTHIIGQEIRSLVGQGKVLTLAPTYVLEGGLEVYPQVATGPFFWRVAGFIDSADRKALNVMGPDDLEDMMAEDPPAAILTGFEDSEEEALLDYAHRHGYRPRPLVHGGVLYLPPEEP
jgi:hypothetical protein